MHPGCWNNPLSFRKSNNYIWIIDDWIGCQRIIFIHSIEIWEMILFLLFLLSWYVCFFCLQPMDSHWTSQNSTGQVWSASSLGCISEGSTQFIVQWRGLRSYIPPPKKSRRQEKLTASEREKKSNLKNHGSSIKMFHLKLPLLFFSFLLDKHGEKKIYDELRKASTDSTEVVSAAEICRRNAANKIALDQMVVGTTSFPSQTHLTRWSLKTEFPFPFFKSSFCSCG